MKTILTAIRTVVIVMLLVIAVNAIQNYDGRTVDEAHSQQIVKNSEKISAMQHDLQILENLNLGDRLARIEERSATNNYLLVSVLVAMVGLLAEAIYRNIGKRSDRSDRGK